MILVFKAFSILIIGVVLLALVSSSVWAAPASKPVTGSSSPFGLDVSYPQCGKSLPSGMAYAVIGVNYGKPTTVNPCLKDQLVWGNTAIGGTKQPKLQLYVNTANPSGLGTASWPTNNLDPAGNLTNNPYGTCSGQFVYNTACAYQYGWNRAVENDIKFFKPAANAAGINTDAAAYTWWLDVETMNSWLPPSPNLDNYRQNVAVIEAMNDYYISKGAKTGLYSTAAQWKEITGNLIPEGSKLLGLPNWRPSGTSLEIAKSNCNVVPLTAGGFISLTQYIRKNLDYNYSCLG